MGKNKRKSYTDGDLDQPNKRWRQDIQGKVDPTSGQRSALPGLDDYSVEVEDAELDYGDGDEALSYLRAVRLEAERIPKILVAPKLSTTTSGESDRSIYDDGIGDTRGYYEDGAYAARPPESDYDTDEPEADGFLDPQVVYFDKIIEKYKALRTQLSLVPPRYALEHLDSDHTFYMAHTTKAFRLWRWRLINTEPEAAQIASMESNMVLKLLRILGENTFMKREGIKKRTSHWIWGLLAKTPHRGELTSEQIGILRELGKRAVWMAMRLKGLNMDALEDAREQDEEEEEVVDIDDGEVDDLASGNEPQNEYNGEESLLTDTIGPVMPKDQSEGLISEPQGTDPSVNPSAPDDTVEDFAKARERLLARLADNTDDDSIEPEILVEEAVPQVPVSLATDEEGYDLNNLRATIDMILTVTGEIYGQRDLLEFREAWGC